MRKKGDLPLTTEEIERAKVYVAQGYSFRRTARELKRSDHSIKKALTAFPEVIAEVKAIKAELVDIFDDVALRMVGSITDDDIKKLNAYQRTVSGAIAVDKSRLLKGARAPATSVSTCCLTCWTQFGSGATIQARIVCLHCRRTCQQTRNAAQGAVLRGPLVRVDLLSPGKGSPTA